MTRQASSNPLETIIRDLRPFLSNIVVSFDEDKDDDKDDDDEKDDEGEGASGTGTDGDKEGSKDAIKDPEKKRLSDEAAAHRVKAKAEKERADTAEAELRKLTDKDKSDLEKAQRDLTEATAKLATAEAQVSDLTLRVAFFESGASSLFKNPVTARKLLDFSVLKPGDNGEYDPKEVKAIADALIKAEPYLSASDGSDGSGSKDESGAPSNGRKGQKPDNAGLVKKFPALASRG
jgi:hypothetical protein